MGNITDENFDIFSLYEGGREKVLQEIGLKFRGLRETQGLSLEQVADWLEVDKGSLSDLESGRFDGKVGTKRIINLCAIYDETFDRVMPYPVMSDAKYMELQRQIKDAGLGFIHGTDISPQGKFTHTEHAFVKPEEVRTEVGFFIMFKVLDSLKCE